MSENLENNPFAQLFPSLEAARNYALQNARTINATDNDEMELVKSDISIPAKYIHINDKIEKLFGISINKYSKNPVIYLEDASPNPEQVWIDLETLPQILFERLLLDNLKSHLIHNDKKMRLNDRILENNVITYLFRCYEVISMKLVDRRGDDDLQKMLSLVVQNISTAMKQPDFYSNQDVFSQFLLIFSENCDSHLSKFFIDFLNRVVDELIKEEENPSNTVNQALEPILKLVHVKIANSNLSSFANLSTLNVIYAFTKNAYTADALITYNTPPGTSDGMAYSNTLFGALLCLSCLPKLNSGEYEFFGTDERGPNTEGPIWTAMEAVSLSVYNIIFQMLKVSPSVKEKTLKWITNCLKSNASRGKLWTTHGQDPFLDLYTTNVSDAFMLNLGAVLLRLCEPIISDRKGTKYLRIDPTYGAWNGFENETCLIPYEGSTSDRPKSESYNFVSEIFFLTHKAIDLGFRVCVEKLMKYNQELDRVVRNLRDAQAAASVNHDLVNDVKERFQLAVTRFLSMQAALRIPKFISLLGDLHVATSRWIVQISLHTFPANCTSYLLPREITLTFPLPETTPSTLACVPEFFLENLNCFIPFVRRFDAEKFETRSSDVLEPIVTMVVLVMRSNRRVKNPHLRAGLVESLECLLPSRDDATGFRPSSDLITRAPIFEEHPHCREIIPSLLDVFVSIEMTGQSVQFDQKYNYRRPIYVLMDYLWKIDIHKECFKKLAKEAEENMEAVDPPIFLRFLNLLINDAVYLLDEALSNMAQLKTMQAARDSGEWTSLPPREREQNEAILAQTGMIARFDNILGRWTISTLQFLTSEIKSIFEHSTMVDRIAAMLNYFLHHLVGPNMKNFKVKAQEQYDFRPGDIVNAICTIYIHLADSDAFCLAISQDGRSYNDKLFIQAEEVLYKIQSSCLVPDLRAVGSKVAKLASHQKRKEELLADAPEEFLDPIMSTLMVDPVILPASHVTVDRATIARHLLSDQIDPFNRAPLTMDMVKPDDELRRRIQEWIEQKTLDQASSSNMVE